MKVVWKYKVTPNSNADANFSIILKVPRGTKPLCVMNQDGKCCIWMEVNPSAPPRNMTFFCVGTGHGHVPDNAKYFGTVMDSAGVWHFYRPNKEPSS